MSESTTPPLITVLPKVTREEVVDKEPDLAWSRDDVTHVPSDQSQRLTDLSYDGWVPA